MGRIAVAMQETSDSILKNTEDLKTLTTQIKGIVSTGGSGGGSGSGLTLDHVNVYIGDFVNDDLILKAGGCNEKYHTLQT